MATNSKPIMSLRRLARLAPELTEPVLVTHRATGDELRVIGTFTPADATPRAAQDGEAGNARPDLADPPDPNRAGLPGSPGAPTRRPAPPSSPRERQRRTDAVLARVNRGGTR